ncbi:MAG: DUF6452 family protein [Flavobacteriaceae bacterium]|tara:strand:+ start:10196 stop:10681 length:486 start_codon:yes stop_codon:yes gene_type:complete
MHKKIFFYSLFIIFFFNCEKDDICLEGTPGTPRLIIRFFDQNEKSTPKSLSNVSIKALSEDKEYIVFSGDSLAIPLKLVSNTTIYTFTFLDDLANQEKVDTLKFNYKRENYYINRACGFLSNLIFTTSAIEILDKESVISGFNILKDTIKNENQAHLAIYH